MYCTVMVSSEPACLPCVTCRSQLAGVQTVQYQSIMQWVLLSISVVQYFYQNRLAWQCLLANKLVNSCGVAHSTVVCSVTIFQKSQRHNHETAGRTPGLPCGEQSKRTCSRLLVTAKFTNPAAESLHFIYFGRLPSRGNGARPVSSELLTVQ